MRQFALLFVSFATVLSFTAKADAQYFPGYFKPVYEVQVEYWFFDTTSYHWSTKLKTDDYALANSYYQALLIAKANGQLNSVVPNSYWRYIAVDVRMITRWEFVAIITRRPYLDSIRRYQE